MLSSSNYTRANLHNFLDPSFYLYLNPELEHVENITKVEDAFSYYYENKLSYETSNLATMPAHVPDRNTFLQDFDANVYSIMYSSNILNDDYISDEVRASISNDQERLAIIHYHRVGRGNFDFTHTNVSLDFNPYLYKVMHGITREMTLSETYYDYLTKKLSDENPVVIGNMQELTYVIGSNVTARLDNLVVNDTLIVKKSISVEKDAHIRGNLVSSMDATIEVAGGTLAITNDYGTLFDESQYSSNDPKIDVGRSVIQYDPMNEHVGGSPALMFDNADCLITSNLFVKQNGIFKESILIGDNLTVDSSYSMQSEKKIRVEATDVLSDARLKQNIQSNDIAECLDKIMRTNVFTFEMIRDQTSTPKVGVIAQEVNALFPNMVSQSEELVPFESVIECTAIDESALAVHSGVEQTKLCVGDEVALRAVFTEELYSAKISAIVDDSIRLEFLDPSVGALIKHEPYRLLGKKEKGVMSVDYNQLFCTLLGAVQELNNKVDALRRSSSNVV